MACNDIVSAILHYKRNIDKISDPPERALKYEDRLLHCINKLYKLPVNVNHLQETGVGKTVNSLRKIEGEKGLGDAAKALVAKWKTMVMMEDEAERKQREECSGPSEDDVNRLKIIREAEKIEPKKTDNNVPKSPQSNENHKKSHEDSKKHKKESLYDGKSRKRKHESDGDEAASVSKRREVSGSESSDAERTSSRTSDLKDVKTKSKSHSSGSSGTSSSNKNKDRETDKAKDKSNHKSSSSRKSHKPSSGKEEKRKLVEELKSNSSKSSSESSGKYHKSSHSGREKNDSKEENKKKQKQYHENDGFDSQSGASFADALGPIVVKKSPKKKSCHNSAVSSPAFSDQSNESGTSTVKEKKKDVNETLFSASKLEPLEPDLVATLPVPTPHYKPFPSYIPNPEAVKRRVQAEEDALSTIMSNKNSRTKVFSGVKGGLSYVPSLYEFCCRVLREHIDALEYTGGIPFSLLKPVLEGATPSQLYRFEHFNPYAIEDTDDLWKFHVNKEFRNEKRQEFESWRDMYLRCIDEREEKYKAVTANIIQRTIENSAPVRKAKLAYIDVAKPPRNILRKQIKNGTAKPDSSRLLGKNEPDAVRVSAPKQPTTREPAVLKVKPKVAPLMKKTLQSIKMSRFKR